MFLSDKTVKNYVSNILRKPNLTRRSAAAASPHRARRARPLPQGARALRGDTVSRMSGSWYATKHGDALASIDNDRVSPQDPQLPDRHSQSRTREEKKRGVMGRMAHRSRNIASSSGGGALRTMSMERNGVVAESQRRKEYVMTKFAALSLGIGAWAAVAALAILITFNVGDKNQVLMFLPILAAVAVAWAIGEAVTERVFVEHDEEA